MEHKAAPEIAFWLCYECDSVFFDPFGNEKARAFSSIYGDYDWPLVEAGIIVESKS